MTELQRRKRNAERLVELIPTFPQRVVSVIAELDEMSEWHRIQDAHRSPEDQLKAFNFGHSKLNFGFHNVTGKDDEKIFTSIEMYD